MSLPWYLWHARLDQYFGLLGSLVLAHKAGLITDQEYVETDEENFNMVYRYPWSKA